MAPERETAGNLPLGGWKLGVRARLLLAFLAISAFAVLAAAAAMYAFHVVGARLDVVDTRVPPTLISLELASSAERVIAAAPALLAAPNRQRRDKGKFEIGTQDRRLSAKMLELKRGRPGATPPLPLEPIIF